MNIQYYKVYLASKKRHDLAERLLNSHEDTFDDCTRDMFRREMKHYQRVMDGLRDRYYREKER